MVHQCLPVCALLSCCLCTCHLDHDSLERPLSRLAKWYVAFGGFEARPIAGRFAYLFSVNQAFDGPKWYVSVCAVIRPYEC